MAHQPPGDPSGTVNKHQIKFAKTGQRFITYCIDNTAVLVVTIIVASAFGIASREGVFLIFNLCAVVYYLCFELFTGRTIGKYITGTKVVSSSHFKSLTFFQGLLRTGVRLIPLYGVVFFFAPIGWHDKWSNTAVVPVKWLKNNLMPL